MNSTGFPLKVRMGQMERREVSLILNPTSTPFFPMILHFQIPLINQIPLQLMKPKETISNRPKEEPR